MNNKWKAYAVAEGEGMKWRGERVAPKYPNNLEHKVVDALGAAGLLVTPAMERFYDACLHGSVSAMLDAGAEIRAERAAREKPEPRWAASPLGDKWGVLRDNEQWWTGFTEAQSRAVAAALNALPGEAGR